VGVLAVTLVLFVGTFVNNSFGFQASVIADTAANSGAQDALLQLDRNPSFASAGYTLSVGSTTVTVAVFQNMPIANLIQVSSTATVSGYVRTVGVTLARNATTSQLTVVSWQQSQ